MAPETGCDFGEWIHMLWDHLGRGRLTVVHSECVVQKIHQLLFPWYTSMFVDTQNNSSSCSSCRVLCFFAWFLCAQELSVIQSALITSGYISPLCWLQLCSKSFWNSPTNFLAFESLLFWSQALQVLCLSGWKQCCSGRPREPEAWDGAALKNELRRNWIQRTLIQRRGWPRFLRARVSWDRTHTHLSEPGRPPFFQPHYQGLLCVRCFPGVNKITISDKESTLVDEMLQKAKNCVYTRTWGATTATSGTQEAGTPSAVQTRSSASTQLWATDGSLNLSSSPSRRDHGLRKISWQSAHAWFISIWF